jgi:octaprenyl-diphosphate synthase
MNVYAASHLSSNSAHAATCVDFGTIQKLLESDMQQVDHIIRSSLSSDVLLIQHIAEHIINGGGKRLRPALVLLAAQAAGYQGTQHYRTAAIVEFIHTATLLHDDVVDESDLRRGKKTAHTLWGNSASILVGDFLYSRAFQLMVELDSMPIMKLLANTTNAIAQGEVLQLMHLNNPDTDESAYLKVIERKTGVLFSAATQLGAILAKLSTTEAQSYADYGLNLGMAFQITDDILDYTSDSTTLGKNIGDDLAEGKATLPIIYAMRQGSNDERSLIRKTLETGDITHMPLILSALERTQAMSYATACAQVYADRAREAISGVTTSKHQQAMLDLVDYSIQRKF